MWTKLLSTILVCTCAGSVNAVAADTTWYCSAVLKNEPKPTSFKFVQTGNELVDLQLSANESTKYRIVEDTDIGLVAIHAKTDMKGKKPEVYVVNYVAVIMINKVSGDFRQRSFTTIEEVGYDIHGSCQAGK
jgi:hypothetical protein